MKIPQRIEDWSLKLIKSLLRVGAFETGAFDFKECLPSRPDDSGKHRLRKSIAAFANSGGGFLVFGIKDDRTLAPLDRIVGVPAAVDFARDFGAFPASCEPGVEWDLQTAPIAITGTSRVLHVFEILSTWRKPHAVMRDGAAHFVKRTNKGDEYMSFGEIKSAFQEAEFRRSGLALLVSELSHMRATAEDLLAASATNSNIEASPDRPWTWATRYSTMLLDVVLGNTFSFLATEPHLWSVLCTIREKARTSNALSEAFSSAVFFRITERIPISDSRVRQLIVSAQEIVRTSKEAERRIRDMQ